GKLRSLLVTSAVAGEGKTTVVLNLAQSFAYAGQRVLVLDADLRRPRVERVFELSKSPGLTEVLRGERKTDEVIRQPAGFGVDVLTSGDVPKNPAELLGSTSFDQLLSELADRYDLVVVDAPVLLAVSDALLLAHRVDGVLLVHAPGKVDKKGFGRVREVLDRAGANVLGLVSNKVSVADPYQYPRYLHSPYVTVTNGPRWRLWRGRRASGSAGS
ncbi:MAG: CpsD/CapB family tyrosine-protein kinase, partial [Planctomycetota bacterium]